MVPLWLHGPHPQAKGEVVLPKVPPHVQEKGPVVVTHQPPPIVIMLPKEEVKNEKRRLLKALLTCVCVWLMSKAEVSDLTRKRPKPYKSMLEEKYVTGTIMRVGLHKNMAHFHRTIDIF